MDPDVQLITSEFTCLFVSSGLTCSGHALASQPATCLTMQWEKVWEGTVLEPGSDWWHSRNPEISMVFTIAISGICSALAGSGRGKVKLTNSDSWQAPACLGYKPTTQTAQTSLKVPQRNLCALLLGDGTDFSSQTTHLGGFKLRVRLMARCPS